MKRKTISAMDAAMVMVIIVVIVQVWLLTSTVELVLAGERSIAIPAAILSGVLFAACAALFLFVRRLDRSRL